MADIENPAVFTNGIGSCDTSDLLQQAFQSVVDNDTDDNEFVTYPQDDDDSGQEQLLLTQKQASEWRLTFDTNNGFFDDDNYLSNEKVTPEDIQRLINQSFNNQTKQTQHEPQPQQLNDIPFDNTDEQWLDDNDDNCNIIESLDEAYNVESLDMQQDDIIENYDNITTDYDYQTLYNSQDENLSNNYNVDDYINETYPSNIEQNIIQESSPQIQQATTPATIPSTYMIKPIDTLLKNTKNIKPTLNGNTVNNTSTTVVDQNLLVLPNNTVYNGLNTQIIRNVTPQIINGNSFNNHSINTTSLLSSSSSSTSTITNGTIKTINNQQFRTAKNVKTPCTLDNNQQYIITSNGKTTNNLYSNFKSQNLNSNNNANLLSATFLKTIPVVQNSSPLIKNIPPLPSSSSALLASSSSRFMSLQNNDAKSRFKYQNYNKTIATSIGTTIRTTNQMNSTPVSILKPQKFTTTNKQIINKNFNSTSMINNESLEKKINCYDKNNDDIPVSKVIKKTKLCGSINSVVNGAADSTKPLGSSENPIQIVQQGQSFHSMQKLSQSQLKQIAHVLQQRSLESSTPNEKVVYRVVFPEELDLRIRNPSNVIKGRGNGKRGRPKKIPGNIPVTPPKPVPVPTPVSTVVTPIPIPTPTQVEEEIDDSKDDRKKIVARTRSGRLSRPPRHMVRDYKHLHHLDFSQPDTDDSDGGYSDYNTNNDEQDIETTTINKDLLAGLELPKRKISDHFRCPTCNKTYLGRVRMSKHFEIHPDHGSLDKLPQKNITIPAVEIPTQPIQSTQPTIPSSTTTTNNIQKNINTLNGDQYKRKGKRRGPWAYATPEAKSERRQKKLQEAISVCDNTEIINNAAIPVLNAKSLFDLIKIKTNNNIRMILDELKILINDFKNKSSLMLTQINDEQVNNKNNADIIDIHDESLCSILGLSPDSYLINSQVFKKSDNYNTMMTTTTASTSTASTNESLHKKQKISNDECKENSEEIMSSGFSESSDLSASDYLNERKNDNTNCPEVLTALTLMPRNSSPIIINNNSSNNSNSNSSTSSSNSSNNKISKLLISNPEIQDQISDNPGFQKIDINTTTKNITKVGNDIKNCTNVFNNKIDNNNYQTTKLNTTTTTTTAVQQEFIKIEPLMQQCFVKLEHGVINTYEKKGNLIKLNGYTNDDTHTFSKGFQKLISNGNKIMTNCKIEIIDNNENNNDKDDKDDLPILRHNDTNIFSCHDNLDNLDILDEKLVDLGDQTNLVDELVSERFKNIMTDNILGSNLLPNDNNVDTDLDFEELSEEFNRNTS